MKYKRNCSIETKPDIFNHCQTHTPAEMEMMRPKSDALIVGQTQNHDFILFFFIVIDFRGHIAFNYLNKLFLAWGESANICFLFIHSWPRHLGRWQMDGICRSPTFDCEDAHLEQRTLIDDADAIDPLESQLLKMDEKRERREDVCLPAINLFMLCRDVTQVI